MFPKTVSRHLIEVVLWGWTKATEANPEERKFSNDFYMP